MVFWSKMKNSRLRVPFFSALFLCALGVAAHLNEVRQTVGLAEKITIVVDCGHGGIDPGKVGVNGAYEKDVNLSIGLFLKEALEKEKCRVIMTRETDIGLYQETDTNKKTADLKKRVEMMNQEDVDLIISVHQNSFSSESSRGAQVFYHSGSESGEAFARLLQAQLISSLDTSNHREAKWNADYYLLKNTEKTAVIVECGFLSNQEEAEKLCDEAYQRQVAWAIAQGTMQYIDTLSEDGGSHENSDEKNKSRAFSG